MSNGQWQPPPPQGPWGSQPQQPAPAYPQQPQQPPPGYGAAPGYPQQPQQPPPGYPQQSQQPPLGYGAAPGYPQQPGYGAPAAPNFEANPFGDMNSGEQIRSLPFLGTDGVDGPPIEGDYKLNLRLVKYKNLRSGGKAIIVEADILESNQPQRPAGTAASVFLMQGQDMSGINTTAFIAAVFGVDPVKLPKNSLAAPWVDPRAGRSLTWTEYAMESIRDDNPWKDRKVACSVVATTKKNGDPFSRHDWQPYDTMVIRERAAPASVAAPAYPAPATPPVVWGQQPLPGAPAPGAWGQQPQPGAAAQPPGPPPLPAQWNQPPAGAVQQQAPAPPAQNWAPTPGVVPTGPWGQTPQR